MSWKSLLVHLDQGSHCPARVDAAVGLAQRFQAGLTGLFGQCARAQHVGVVATWPPESYRAAAKASRQAWTQATAPVAAKAAPWRDANRGSVAEVTRAVVTAARAFDLTILGQDETDGPAPAGLTQAVLGESGRPALILPYAWAGDAIGKRALVAWTHAREAARALHDSLPLLRGAEQVTLVSIARDHPAHERDAATDAIACLRAHGVVADLDVLSVHGIGVMDMLLNRAADLGADLLVMGAHLPTGPGLGQRSAGTRHMLAHMTVPVLMSA